LGVERWAFSEDLFQRSTSNVQRPTPNSERVMRRYSQRQSLSTLSEINITPLLDLAFVLLIIFMITTPLLESSVNLVIPSSGTKNPPIKTSHVQTVSIDRADTIRFNNQLMDLETLTTQLVQLKQTDPDIAIVIRPDRDLPVQKLIGVMDALQRAGITKVGIATRATSRE
jgi:biopolymer transport protein ExbD